MPQAGRRRRPALNERVVPRARSERINAAAREHDLSYNRFMAGVKRAGIELDRTSLADIAVSDPKAFAAVAERAKAALESEAA